MKIIDIVRISMVMGICLSLSTACKSTKGKKGPGEDLLRPEQLDGDYALGSRFEEGVRITDVQFDPVYFDYDSFQVKGSEQSKIDPVAAYMKQNRHVRLIVEGHCDERGSREYNMSLGEHRAQAMRARLIVLGVDGARIQTRSFGEEQPARSGHGESVWKLNRRGEFALYR